MAIVFVIVSIVIVSIVIVRMVVAIMIVRVIMAMVVAAQRFAQCLQVLHKLRVPLVQAVMHGGKPFVLSLEFLVRFFERCMVLVVARLFVAGDFCFVLPHVAFVCADMLFVLFEHCLMRKDLRLQRRQHCQRFYMLHAHAPVFSRPFRMFAMRRAVLFGGSLVRFMFVSQ